MCHSPNLHGPWFATHLLNYTAAFLIFFLLSIIELEGLLKPPFSTSLGLFSWKLSFEVIIEVKVFQIEAPQPVDVRSIVSSRK